MTGACDIAVVGGGAAGLAAAIFAAETGRHLGATPHVIVFDGAPSIGAKILISGGGRCNITHDVVTTDDFNGPRNVIRNILAAFDAKATQRWFASLGVELKREESGKLFPVTDQARTVLDALLGRCTALGIDISTRHRVTTVTARTSAAPCFTIAHQDGGIEARAVILATGGRSLPRTGSDGAGWMIAQQFGHTVTDTYPALVPLVLRAGFHAAVSGVSHEVELSTFAAGKRIDRRTGSLLWTHFGISGPVVLDASRHWVIAAATKPPAELRANFVPDTSFDQFDRALIAAGTRRPRARAVTVLAERLPDRVAAALIAATGLEVTTCLSQLSRDQRRALAHRLTGFVFDVARARGWDFAEVTAGGVPLAEVDYRTMASRRQPGLYLVGEMLDCDGRIGGFNFQWAWSTGYVAGRAAALSTQH